MSTSGAEAQATIGDQLHAQTRRPMTSVMFLLGVIVILLASEHFALETAIAALPLRVFLGVYIVCVVGATLTIRRGIHHPSYLVFNWTETALLTVGTGLLIVASGTPHSLLWLLYFLTVLHGARAAQYRRFNHALFVVAPIVVAAGFVIRGDHSGAVISLAMGYTALYTYLLFLGASDRQAEVERDRDRLQKRLANLALVEERERIARDLHDGFGASLTAALWEVRRTAETPADAAIEHRLMACLDELGALVWTTRRDDRDLAAFWSYLRRRCDDLFGAEVPIEYALPDGDGAPLDNGTAIAAMFIVFEALRNCVRHARAKHVRVSARFDADALAIEIRDDGAGFDPEAATRGHGLTHMDERARGAGGTLEIRSSAGHTIVSAKLPVMVLERRG